MRYLSYEYITEKPFEYYGYYALGDEIIKSNIVQAYLCYEMALFYCEDEKIKKEISMKINSIVDSGIRIPKMSMIILSYNNYDLTRNCLESIRKNVPVPLREIIVIDNASTDNSVDYLRQQKDIIFIKNDNNEGFTKACNQGIELSQLNNDILLLNNDTVVMPNSMFWLSMGLYERETIATASCMTNAIYSKYRQTIGENNKDMKYYENVARLTNIPLDNCLENKTVLAGFCLLIKREAINTVGVLDERFNPGHFEDMDYCLRVLSCGMENVLVHNSYIVHIYHASFRKRKGTLLIVEANNSKLNQKYGVENVQELSHRTNNLSKCCKDLKKNSDVLEFNCGLGENIFKCRYENANINFYGINKYDNVRDIRKNEKFLDIYNYTKIEDIPFKDKQFDLVYLDASTIRINEFEEYIKNMLYFVKQSGYIVIYSKNPLYYKNWINNMLNDIRPSSCMLDNLTESEASSLIKKNGGVPYRWIMSYDKEIENIELEEVQRIIYSFDDRKRKNITSKGYTIFVRKNKDY